MNASTPRLPTREYRGFVWDSRRWSRYVHRPGDIFVCTPPKCGTTWTQTLVTELLFPAGDAPAPVTTLAPWWDARFVPLEEMVASTEAQAHRRSFKTHTPADGVPLYATGRYIVVARDGRDAFMSFVNHVASMRPDRVAELIQSAIEEGIPLEGPMPSPDIHQFFAGWLESGDFFGFLSTWWELRDEPNVLFVHYDDLKADLEREARRIAAFAGIPVDETLLPGVLARCSFDYMRENSHRIGEFGELFTGGAQSFFFRGVNGRWKDVLGADELATYERASRAAMPADLKAWVDRAGGASAA